MKKIIYTLMLLITLSGLYASPLLKADSTTSSLDIIDKSGKRIDKNSWIEEGYIVRTGDEGAMLSSGIGSIYLYPESLIEAESQDSIYLVFGKASFLANEDLSSPIIVKTPTTSTLISGKGETLFISTDEEEKFYNFSEKVALSYDAITKIEYSVNKLEMVDHLKMRESTREVSRYEYVPLSFTRELFPTPLKPNALVQHRDLIEISVPYKPYFMSISRSIFDSNVSRVLHLENGDIFISAENGNAFISFPEDIVLSDAISFLRDKNPDFYKSIVFETVDKKEIRVTYPKENSKEELEKAVDTFIDDMKQYVETLPRFSSIHKEFATDYGTIEVNAEDGVMLFSLPEGYKVDEYLNGTPSTPLIKADASTLTLEYSKNESENDLLSLANIYSNSLSSYSFAKPRIISSSITSSDTSGKRTFSFDLRLYARAYTDSATNQNLSLSVIPSFRYGSLNLSFNIDPYSILDYENNDGALDWTGYILNFLDAFQFRTMDETFAIYIDKERNLSGDKLGLYGGYRHIWDRETRPLSVEMAINTTHFDMNVYSDDLTFKRFALNKVYRTGIIGADMLYRISDRYPVEFSLGLLSSLDYNEMENSILYPELGLYVPFYSKGYNSVGLLIGGAGRIELKDAKANPFDRGFIISASMPMTFKNITANAGIYYTNQANASRYDQIIHYKGVNSSRYFPMPIEYSLLTLSGDFSYSGKYFGFDFSMLGDINLDDMRFIGENSLLEASTYISLFGVTARAGISMQDFTNGDKYKDCLKLYTGLDLDIGGVSTTIQAGFENLEEKDFFLSYGASASFLGKSTDRAENPIKIPFSFEINTGFDYRFNEEKSYYTINPIMTIGKDRFALSLRAPLQLSFNESGEFALAGWGGRKWWDFGAGESGDRKMFYAISDSLQLINYITLGSPESSLAYLVAQRDYLISDTLFTAFGSEDALSLRTGFNFYNLSVELYCGNISSPHIAQIRIGVYPIDLDGFSIDVSIPSEFYILDRKNFSLFIYPEIRLNVPMFNNHFNIAIYGVGSISAIYEDGAPAETRVIYDFVNKRPYAALLGGEMGLKWQSFNMTMQSGLRVGPLTPDMYNIFTSTYNLMPSLENEDKPSSVYAKITTDFKFKPVELSLAYSLSDVEAVFSNYKSVADDIFSATARIHFNTSISLFGSFNRKGFISLFQKGTDFDDIFKSKDTIYSVGMDFDYGIVSIKAEYSSVLDPDGFISSSFINVNPKYIKNTCSSSFSITSKVKF